ncbi:glycosyltransferase family 2 protein [Providencia sp. PROV250]|uniref:glycosyltransferase family 2 protein n=1 Tax=Providencia TaxID=586 RepID=UPI00234B0395|nr:glycosyltransferase family 2 protein [Providencia sp. PROV250]
MKKIYISVVSHGHGKMISKIDSIRHLNNEFFVVIKNNCSDNIIVEYCRENNIAIIDNDYGLGFGENNNINYLYCKHNGMKEDDFFLVLNPDIDIQVSSLKKFNSIICDSNINISTINLFIDKDYKKYDYSIRKFPTLITFISSFLGFKNKSIIDKSNMHGIITIDWAAGSFLCFKSKVYRELGGFNESYFMYCEDVDICYRSQKMGYSVNFISSIKATHLAQHTNRKIFNKHFYWHLKSALRFISVKARGMRKNTKSRILP